MEIYAVIHLQSNHRLEKSGNIRELKILGKIREFSLKCLVSWENVLSFFFFYDSRNGLSLQHFHSKHNCFSILLSVDGENALIWFLLASWSHSFGYRQLICSTTTWLSWDALFSLSIVASLYNRQWFLLEVENGTVLQNGVTFLLLIHTWIWNIHVLMTCFKYVLDMFKCSFIYTP